ncbi:hypothetical protein [Streptomyces sp. NPDC057002]|uniref:hypothetical protein n=1 Tax=Streptomyces sp. NPDC057002 TaxID=3345992 RepID=UPI0036404C26
MADIKQIRATVHTSSEGGSETYSWIYLGIGGREFALTTGDNGDFEKGAKTCFIMGEENTEDADIRVAPVQKAEYNDPRKPQLLDEDLDLYPAYIRMDTSGSVSYWCVDKAEVHIKTSDGRTHHFGAPRLQGSGEKGRIWLHTQYGTRLGLVRLDRIGRGVTP